MRERRRRRSSEQLIVGVEHVGPEHLMGSAFEKIAEWRTDMVRFGGGASLRTRIALTFEEGVPKDSA